MSGVLTVKPGLSANSIRSIPDAWNKEWFRRFITDYIQPADVRNAVFTGGVTVTPSPGGPSQPPTVGFTPPPIANNTVLGNVSGGPAVAVGLTQVQLTALVNQFTATLAGVVPPSGGGSVNILYANGTWGPPAALAPIPNNTVLGNISGSSASPSALTRAQLTALVNLATVALSGTVPALSGSATQFFNGVGAFSTPASSISSANPSATIGLAVVNGTATTFMTSDSAPPLSQAITPTWTHQHIFASTAAATNQIIVNGTSDASSISIHGIATAAFNVADLAILRNTSGTANTLAGGSNITLGDSTGTPSETCIQNSGGQTEIWQLNAGVFAQILKILTTRGVVLNTPASGVALTIGGFAAIDAVIVNSGSTAASNDVTVNRTATTANSLANGANLTLADTGAITKSLWQHSGGQSELWQLNGGVWNQILKVLTTRGVAIGAPASGDALLVSNVAGGNALVVAGNAAGTAVVRLNTQATTGAQTAIFTATNKPGAASVGPDKWIPINLDGTVHYVPAWQ